MNGGALAKAVPFAVVGLFVGTTALSLEHITSSRPGDLAYGTKEAVLELRTAVAPGGEKKSDRYLDEVDMTLAELTLLDRTGASEEAVAETAEKAVTTERHAQAERSRAGERKESPRHERHQQALEQALRTTKRPVVRHSIRQMLEIVSSKPKPSGRK